MVLIEEKEELFIEKIKINGKQIFMGIEIPVIEGGFGEGQKVVLVKTVAEIHEVDVKEINKLINNNKDEFEYGIDILDLKTGDYKEPVLANGLFTKAQWGNANNIYLLSEQGYMALVQLMRTEKAKEIRKNLRREYFSMRQTIKQVLSEKDAAILAIVNANSDIEYATAIRNYDKVVTAPLHKALEEAQPLVDFANTVQTTDKLINVEKMAKLLKDEEHIDVGGRNKLFQWLREQKILKGDNIPYQQYIDSGYFKVKESTKETNKGSLIFCTTKITGKGQMWITKKVKECFS